MSDLLELAARVEAAEPIMQAKLIEQAWIDIFVGYGGDLNTANWTLDAVNRWGEFQHFLEASAFLDAAMTLVPEEFGRPAAFTVQRTRNFDCCAVVWHNSEFNRYVNGNGKSPALALCAAALKARAAA